MPETKFRVLNNIYFDASHPASFSSVLKLYKAAKQIRSDITLADTKHFLQNTRTYTTHKRKEKKFPRRKTIVSGIDDQWQIDLINIMPLSKYNHRFVYLLSVIDCFSRYAYIEPLRNKTAEETLKAFKIILQRANRPPKIIQKDDGTEFKAVFGEFLRDNNIHFFSTSQDMKCAIVERFNRTIQDRIYRFVTAKDRLRYEDLQQIVYSYNHSKHSTLGISPAEVTPENEQTIWEKQYKKYLFTKKVSLSFRIGDKVLISKLKKTFTRGYQPQYKSEIFQIAYVLRTKPPTYVLIDKDNQILKGNFYAQELSKIVGA